MFGRSSRNAGPNGSGKRRNGGERKENRRSKKEQRKSENTRGRRAREEIPRTVDRSMERTVRSKRDDGPPLQIGGRSSSKQVSGQPQISPEDVIRNIQNQRRKKL